MKVHFISIGGSAMHNLALAMYSNDYAVSGSDDEIYEPSKSRLEKKGLLPKEFGWFPERISKDIDLVILGMHAKPDNIELKKAQELGLKIVSYPEFIYLNAKNKKRIVIAGSHGKTTTTSIIMHVLKLLGINFDYLVGAQIDGFENMVRLSDAPIMVIEGDEYLSSPIDIRPKIMHYKPHLALITGIAWDHINVFTSFEIYIDQFKKFINEMSPDGTLIGYKEDQEVVKLVEAFSGKKVYYDQFRFQPCEDGSEFYHSEEVFKTHLLGAHNLQNLKGAYTVCKELGITDSSFFKAIESFKGAAKRLQILASNFGSKVFLDFAHAPSKVKATANSMKEQFPNKKVIIALELHTYSSLNAEFLPQYQGTLDAVDEAYVCFSAHALAIKRLQPITSGQVKEAFANESILVYDDPKKVVSKLSENKLSNTILILMTSGSFAGTDLKEFAGQILSNRII